MKKIFIIIFAAVVLLAIGICVWRIIHKNDKLCAVNYRSEFGYTLSMTATDGHITVIYADDGREPIVKTADDSCYTNILDILDTYDFRSWRHLSDKKASADGCTTLEISYESGKTFFFSQSQDLPEKAQGIFSVINTCLMEYAGIVKS